MGLMKNAIAVAAMAVNFRMIEILPEQSSSRLDDVFVKVKSPKCQIENSSSLYDDFL
jgi:hypothetical protein